ncbi:MAG: Crp/Fnr family transcriptional regulator [Psychroflexus sp.]|jgi:CRP/FNR family transcriptional regulator|nr:Crp/Fnr family transcriptional regulator [Psychroflexus sp.]MDR9447795.1 Crp/Fnr family transcriptional regulator [Psychroflexus sp.]
MEEAVRLHFGHLFEPDLVDELEKHGYVKKVKKGEQLVDVGQYIKSMPLVMKGSIKVMREDEEGYELLLYFLDRSQTCTMMMDCCMGNKKSEIIAIAETDAQLFMLPIQKMEEWLSQYKTWRNFIFQSYNDRMHEILKSLDNIAFKKMDERLLNYLNDKRKFSDHNMINSTHQQIADDLHTSRVVVSRLLKKLENDGQIKLKRNAIHFN